MSDAEGLDKKEAETLKLGKEILKNTIQLPIWTRCTKRMQCRTPSPESPLYADLKRICEIKAKRKVDMWRETSVNIHQHKFIDQHKVSRCSSTETH